LNAGAEYVLCRLWATLQERDGIHAESLLACLGALAGYACQVGAVQPPGRQLSNKNQLLKGTPVSICTLVGRTVEKLGAPAPDFDEIFRHVVQTLGTAEFGVPRAPSGHRPRHLPLVYLKQIWPQILPIAQPFCRRSSQLPVLFGIAIQRTLELTQTLLNPVHGASIAVECAVAMSKVALPRTEAALPEPAIKPEVIRPTWVPAARPVREVRLPDPLRESAYHLQQLFKPFERLAPAARNTLTIAALAIVAMAGTILSTDRGEPSEIVRETRLAQLPAPRNDFPPAVPEETLPPETPPIQEMQVAVARNVPVINEETDGPAPIPEQPANEGIIADEGQGGTFDSGSGGDSMPGAMIVES
jgi:hypothetical protein